MDVSEEWARSEYVKEFKFISFSGYSPATNKIELLFVKF